MPRVERKAVQGFLLSAVVPKRMVGQHLMIYDKLLKESADHRRDSKGVD